MPSNSKAEAPPEPWRSFLVALDALVDERIDLHCIGGFVVSTVFGISRTTADIDILAVGAKGSLAKLQRLGGRGSDLEARFKVYLQPVAVNCYPEDYERRLIRLWPKFRLSKLRVFATEAHDLALTKLQRNRDVDRQDILALAAAGLIDEKTLRERYEEEFRPNLVGNVEREDLTMGLWIEMCWPKENHPR